MMLQCLGREKIPLSLTTVELGVQLHCEGCEKRIRERLYRMDGVDTVDVDSELQKVTVSGYVEPRKVLRAVRRTGAVAEYWPFPTDTVHYAYLPRHLQQYHYQRSTTTTSQPETAYGSSNYNQYYCQYPHQYYGNSTTNTQVQGSAGFASLPSSTTVQSTRVVDVPAASMFSDDNVHACHVM